MTLINYVVTIVTSDIIFLYRAVFRSVAISFSQGQAPVITGEWIGDVGMPLVGIN